MLRAASTLATAGRNSVLASSHGLARRTAASFAMPSATPVPGLQLQTPQVVRASAGASEEADHALPLETMLPTPSEELLMNFGRAYMRPQDLRAMLHDDEESVMRELNKVPSVPLAVNEALEKEEQAILKQHQAAAQSPLARQYELEVLAVERTVERYRTMCAEVIHLGKGASLGPVQRMLTRWFEPLSQAIDREQRDIWTRVPKTDVSIYGPYLLLLPPEKLAVITMHTVMSNVLSSGGTQRLLQVALAIGKVVQAEVHMMKLKRSNRDAWRHLSVRGFSSPQTIMKYARMALDHADWGTRVNAKVGCALLDLLFDTATLRLPAELVDNIEAITMDMVDQPGETSVDVPAFRHTYEQNRSRRVGCVELHPVISTLMANGSQEPHHATYYPMLVPPTPWTRPKEGGYLKQRVGVMRTESRKATSALNRSDPRKVYEGLNVLGRVPWRINNFVHGVVRQAWQSGGGLAELPAQDNLPSPQLPAEDELEDLDPDEYSQVMKRHSLMSRRVMQQNRDLHSLRCDFRLKLGVADMFANDVVYFPHNLDFRGRAYPVPPHLNHMGADLCRGLLTFAERRPLGSRGLWWLKVHLANLMGVDKLPRGDRAKFVDEHMDQVLDSAANPLDGRRWWLDAEYPWQALACCNEIAQAVKSGDPENFMSCLPTHQDGSCNGLQHYAALGLDAEGGAAVNLTPSDRPQDVYSVVCRKVIAQVEADATAPPPPEGTPADLVAEWERKRAAAQFVRGHVDRKVVKQTVMTSVYGVTMIGARAQIQARLKEKFEGSNMPPEQLETALYSGAWYLAHTTLLSLRDMFKSADAIKEWLSECAKLVGLQNQPMAWVTPLGLPVVQPYRRDATMTVHTIVQNLIVANNSDTLPVSVQKQRTAFPPNFVHSLDSTHMLMTALDCSRKGLTFAAVHDSFWTHAGDVDTMNASLRQQFHDLYSMPLLEDFKMSLELRFPTVTFPEVPARGKLDLRVVRDSQYFFS